MEEGKITFECRLVGEPRPDVSWYHNERRVESRRHKVTLTEDETKMFYLVRLEITGVEAADAGTYKAVASNATGEGHATINLTFEEGECIHDGLPAFHWLWRRWEAQNLLQRIEHRKLNYYSVTMVANEHVLVTLFLKSHKFADCYATTAHFELPKQNQADSVTTKLKSTQPSLIPPWSPCLYVV